MTLIEDLLDLQSPDVIRVSPNAQQVLYSTTFKLRHKKGEHEQSTLWLAETGKPKSARQLTSGSYCDKDPRWHPDGNSIAFISDRAKQGEQWGIWMLDLKDGVAEEPYLLTPAERERKIEKFDFTPQGQIVFLSGDEKTAERKASEKGKDDAKVWGEDWTFNKLRVLDLKRKKEDPSGTHITTFAHEQGRHIVDVANCDGSKYPCMYFLSTETPDIESPHTKGTGIGQLNHRTDMWDMSNFPRKLSNLHEVDGAIYFLGPANPENVISSSAVYVYDIPAGSRSYEKYAHGEEDCAKQLGKAGKDITVLVQHGMEDQIRMLKGKTLFSSKKEILAWDAAFTQDSDEMIVAVAQGDPGHPPEVFTTTASGGALVQLSSHGEQFLAGHGELGIPHFLRCKSADDKVDLDAVYITPTPSTHSKPLPTVLWIHGGPYNRDTATFDPSYYMWVPSLLAAGYGILCCNYRGSSGRGEAFAAYARGGCGTVDYDDIITLTSHAIEEGYADEERLVISGWSQGGFHAFLACVRNGRHDFGWKFKAAIAGAGVSEQDSLCLTSDLGVFQGELSGKAPWESDKEDVSGRKGSALWEFKAAVDKGVEIPPILILHGEADERVPIEQSVGMRRAFQQAQLPFEMVVYPREGHLFKERKHIADMAERVVKFVDLHIGGRKDEKDVRGLDDGKAKI